MKRWIMFAGMLTWSNLLEADVAQMELFPTHDSISVDWYVPMILLVVALGIVSIYVLRRMRKREEPETLSETDIKHKGE